MMADDNQCNFHRGMLGWWLNTFEYLQIWPKYKYITIHLCITTVGISFFIHWPVPSFLMSFWVKCKKRIPEGFYVSVLQTHRNRNNPAISPSTSSKPTFPSQTWQKLGVVKKNFLSQIVTEPASSDSPSNMKCLRTWTSLFSNNSVWLMVVGCEILTED